jgi:hypothetical protein
LVQRARLCRAQLRALFMTGYADTTQIDAEAPEIPMLRKPFKVKDLAHKVRLALG